MKLHVYTQPFLLLKNTLYDHHKHKHLLILTTAELPYKSFFNQLLLYLNTFSLKNFITISDKNMAAVKLLYFTAS